MQVNATNSITSTQQGTQSTSTLPVQTLTQDDFLKLLVAQFQAQDPLNPQTDTEFISQMASFSALEQSKQMQQNIALMQANDLIGRVVSLKDSSGALVTGTVNGVVVESGVPKIVVDGEPYDLRTLVAVVAAQTNTQAEGA